MATNQTDPDLPDLASILRASNEIYKRTVKSRANWIRVEEGSPLHRLLDPSAVDLLGDLVRGSSTTS